MQRLSGTARDVLVVAAISTINVELVLGEFVRCFHRPPGASAINCYYPALISF